MVSPASRSRGIIPAYAGSTSSIHTKGEVKRDHPRIRGEHATRRIAGSEWDGSSPHTRGARRASCRRTRDSRIIPAYAGSTASA